MTEKTTKKRTVKAPSFETQLKQLEELVAKLESGGLGLEESIEAYEKAMALCTALDQQLEAGEKKLTVLQNGAEQPFEAEDLPL